MRCFTSFFCPGLLMVFAAASAVRAQAPVPLGEVVWVHAPYEVGECSLCHEGGDPADPGPVAAGDCSACHLPHGGETFRLLVSEYPAKFYSPFEPANYELYFTCHDERVVTMPETTTLTNFRNGSNNLHFLHVNKAGRGRTCRACHEVHAGQKAHIIRASVPYGSKGWLLPINYEPSPNGASARRPATRTRYTTARPR